MNDLPLSKNQVKSRSVETDEIAAKAPSRSFELRFDKNS